MSGCDLYMLFSLLLSRNPCHYLPQRRLCTKKASPASIHAVHRHLSPVRATKYICSIRSSPETYTGRPAAAPREKDDGARRRSCSRSFLAGTARSGPLRLIGYRADCGFACRATSRSSASRIHPCWHPSITCGTVAQVRLREAISGHWWSSSVTWRGNMMPS